MGFGFQQLNLQQAAHVFAVCPFLFVGSFWFACNSIGEKDPAEMVLVPVDILGVLVSSIV
jgi:hypothetical protein